MDSTSGPHPHRRTRRCPPPSANRAAVRPSPRPTRRSESSMDPPQILIAHPMTAAAEAIAALLAELRPHFAIRLVAPPDLDAALSDGPAPIVICAEPTLPVQERA